MGLKRAFDRHGFETDEQVVEDEWEVWKAKALEDWKYAALLEIVLNADDQPGAPHDHVQDLHVS